MPIIKPFNEFNKLLSERMVKNDWIYGRKQNNG